MEGTAVNLYVYVYSSPILRESRGVVFIQEEKMQILVPKEKWSLTKLYHKVCISKSKKPCTNLKERVVLYNAGIALLQVQASMIH